MRYILLIILLSACEGIPSTYELSDVEQFIPDADEVITVDSDLKIDSDSDPEVSDREEGLDSNYDSDYQEDSQVDENTNLEDTDPEPICEEEEELCNKECVDLNSDSNNCGRCGNRCTRGRLSHCFKGICSGWTECWQYPNISDPPPVMPDCNDRCADLRGTESLDCRSGTTEDSLRENPARWRWYLSDWTEVGWDSCEDPYHHPPQVITGTTPYIWSCCCAWE